MTGVSCGIHCKPRRDELPPSSPALNDHHQKPARVLHPAGVRSPISCQGGLHTRPSQGNFSHLQAPHRRPYELDRALDQVRSLNEEGLLLEFVQRHDRRRLEIGQVTFLALQRSAGR